MMVRGRLVIWDDGKAVHRFMEGDDGSVYYTDDDYATYDVPKRLEEVTELDIPTWYRQKWLGVMSVKISEIIEAEDIFKWWEKALGIKFQPMRLTAVSGESVKPEGDNLG